MKKITLTLIVLAAAFSQTNATIISVSNNAAYAAPHNTILAAISAANSGDTLYIYGSGVNYTWGGTTLTKSLVFIGNGANPSGMPKQSTSPTRITGDLNLNSSSSGSQFIGLTLLGNAGIRVNETSVNNITISRCHFITYYIYSLSSAYSPSTWLISENLFSSDGSYPHLSRINFGGAPWTNILITKNVFEGAMIYENLIMNGTTTSAILINHNTFRGQGTSQNVFGNCTSGFTISDNVFKDCGLVGINSAILNYNLFPTGTTVPFGSGNSFSLNVIGDAVMVAYPGGSSNYVNYILEGKNYDLASGSPGENVASDGTDMGAFGGVGTHFGDYKLPAMPYIESSIITSGMVVPAGSTINVNFVGKAKP